MESSPGRLVIFDCDSTLSSAEGIDELGRFAGPEVFQKVEEATREAMEGLIRVEDVFGRRLELIRPTRDQVDQVARLYLETIEPGAVACVNALRAEGWECAIISGGFRPCIRPLADHLGIARVEAVDLFFNGDGSYRDYDRDYPTTRSGGKPEVVRQLKKEWLKSGATVVMVGDGVSDLEAKPEVNLFVGFGRYAVREKVKAGADRFITGLAELPAILAGV
jgi:phosphoserine phosphatase